MKYFSSLLMVVLLAAMLLVPFAHASADSYIPNRIIDDSVFDNSGSMSAGQIDSWLNTNFPSSCISTRSGFSAPDPIGYNSSQGFLYGGNVSAGQVIADAANAYGLNPQVLIATLQKESSVVSGDATYHCQYMNTAMGYGCPDSGSCPTDPATMSGFSKQIIHAAWLFKFGEQRSEGNTGWAVIRGGWNNSDDPPTCYGGPMTQGTLSRGCGQAATYYDGYTTIDGTAVHIDDGATAALYWYTPHFSGNQHFFSLFTSWFGPTVGTVLLQGTTSTVYLVSNGTRYAVPSSEVLWDYGLLGTRVTPSSDSYIGSLTDGGILGTLFTMPGDNTVYVADYDRRIGIPSGAMCTAWGFDCSANGVRVLSSSIGGVLINGGVLQPYLSYNGYAYKMQSGVRSPYLTAQAGVEDGANLSQVTVMASALNIGTSVGPPIIQNKALVRFPVNGTVYYYTNGHFYAIPDGNTYNNWFLGSGITFDQVSSYSGGPPVVSGILSSLFATSGGNTYLLNNKARIDVTSQASNWPTATTSSDLDDTVTALPLATTASTTSTVRTPDSALSVFSGGTRRILASMNDFYSLGYDLNHIINVNQDSLSAMPSGLSPIGEGSIFKVVGDPTSIYLKGPSNSLYYLTTQDQLGQFQLTRIDPLMPAAQLNQYSAATPLSSFVSVTGSPSLSGVVDASHKLWTFDSNDKAAWGITSPTTTTITGGGPIYNALSNTNSHLPVFAWYNGTVYYASGGVKHPIATNDSYLRLGGNSSNTFFATKDFIDAAPTGSIL